MPLLSNNVATFDSELAKIEVLETLVKTSRVYCPLVEKYMKIVPTTGSRIEWSDQKLGNDKVFLSVPYTAGAPTITLQASSLVQSYSIKPGVHQLLTPSGTAYYNITNFNTTTNVATITLAEGADGDLGLGAELWLVRSSDIGEDASANNDVQFAASDYNYLSNFSFTVRIANPNKNGQIQYFFEEITFDNQLENNVPEAMRTLERRFIKDFRRAGTGGATRNGNVIQSGNGSRAGGILSLGNARGLYTASGGSAVISEDLLEIDIGVIRDRGGFNTMSDKTRDMGLGYCELYCGAGGITGLNKLTRLQRDPSAFFGQSDKIGGNAGTFTNSIIADGVLTEWKPSDGLANNELLYVPKEDLLELRVVRLMEEQEPIYRGDNEIRTYQVTYTTVVKSPYQLGYRSNLVV